MSHRTLIVGIALGLVNAGPSPAAAPKAKPAPLYVPTGLSVRAVVEAGIAQLNQDRTFKLQLPARGSGTIVHNYSSTSFVAKDFQKKQVRWPGVVVENTDKKSKAILVLVGTFQAGGGQTFQARVGVSLPRRSAPATVGTQVWVQGVLAGGGGFVAVQEVDEKIVITPPIYLKNGRLLGEPAAKPEDARGEEAGKQEQEAGSKLRIARLLADNGKVDKARERCREIIKQYPRTKAAEEAGQLLQKLNKK